MTVVAVRHPDRSGAQLLRWPAARGAGQAGGRDPGAGRDAAGRDSDWDHNRSVITVAGVAGGGARGLFRAVAAAAESIDLFTQSGVHPRIGAADVVPLVPMENISLEECAEHRVRWAGASVRNWSCRSISTRPPPPGRNGVTWPTCGAGSSSSSAGRSPSRNGSPTSVRRAGAEPARWSSARAGFLVAYNFFLASDDVEIARHIAAPDSARAAAACPASRPWAAGQGPRPGERQPG